MITLDLESFQQSREGGSVTGVIFLSLHDAAFPERGWSDFPVIILGWWAHALIQLEASTSVNAQWAFMDGPYSVTFTKTTGDTSGGTLLLSQVHTSLLEVSERVVAHCDRRRFLSKDLDLLRYHLEQLKANQTVEITALALRVQP